MINIDNVWSFVALGLAAICFSIAGWLMSTRGGSSPA